MKSLFTLLAIHIVYLSFGQTPKKSEVVHVNGIDLYYEVFGRGEPLLLLHGWTQTSQFWLEYTEDFAKEYEVYAIDLRGHGKTSPLTEQFSIEKVALDIKLLIDQLNLKKINAIGLSYGGLVLLQFVVHNPNQVEKMVLIGASHQYAGGKNEELNNKFDLNNLPTEFLEQLQREHHHGQQQIEALFNPNLKYEISLTEQEVKSIQTESLVISGDRDEIMGMDSAVDLHRLLPNSQLWIVPDAGHIPIIESKKSTFIQTTLDFLDKGRL